MGKSMNRAILIGHLGKDPELTYTQGGTAKCRFSVATSERTKNRAGEYEEQTTWHNIVVWGAQAEACGQYLKKGRQVSVEGKIENRSYEQNGATKYISEIIAREVIFLGGEGGSRGGGEGGGRGASGPGRGADGHAGGGAPQGGRRQGGGGHTQERRGPTDASWADPDPQPPAGNSVGNGPSGGGYDDDDIPF
jgi:single-strand DNA-binding protein